MTRRGVLLVGCVARIYGFCVSRCVFESWSSVRKLYGCRRNNQLTKVREWEAARHIGDGLGYFQGCPSQR